MPLLSMGFMLLGKKGELIAKKYLESKGYKYLESNFNTRWGEIDLVMQKDKQVIFIEVKTRTAGNLVAPNYMLSEKKLARLERAADIYMKKHRVDDWKYLLVGVTKYRKAFKIKLINF